MTAAYLMAFALGVIPCLSSLVSMAFFALGVTRAKHPNTSRQRVWLPIGAAVAAAAVSVWQGVTFDDMFFDWTLSGVQHARVLGLEIPFEVGENAAKLTWAIFFGLVVAWAAVRITASFRSQVLTLGQRAALLACVVAFGWLGWRVFADAVSYWQRLF